MHTSGTMAGCPSYRYLSWVRDSVLSKQPMYNPAEDFKGSEDYCNVYNQTNNWLRKLGKFKGLTGKGLWEESLSLKYLARLENLFPSFLAIY